MTPDELPPIQWPRLGTFRNPLGDADAWYAALRKRWWMTKPIRLGPQKLHVYGVLSRRTWRSAIHSIEITDRHITVIRLPKGTR